MKSIFKSVLVLACALVLTACDRAPSNVQTMLTKDCGVGWTAIKPGERIPTIVGSCEYMTVLPNFPMQGDAEFMTQFKGKVLVKVRVSYDYEIVDGVKYIGEAKFLGKAAAKAADASNQTALAAYEMAENAVIDKRVKEVTTSQTREADIVDVDLAKLEDDLEKALAKDLLQRGVGLRSMTFVTIPEEQTRMAIDAATAMNVYANKGLKDFGEKLAVARAGASRITVTTDGK